MSDRTTTLIAVSIALLALSGAVSGIVGATTQSDDSDVASPTPADWPNGEGPTETPADGENGAQATETATESPTPEPTENGDETALIAVSSDVRIISQTWLDGGAVVEFTVEADRAARVVTTDASINLANHEAVDIPRESRTVPEGRTTIRFSSVSNPDSAAVTVGADGGLVGLSPGDGSGLWSRAAGWVDVRVAGIAALFGVPAVGLGVWARVARRRVDVEGADL